ADKKLSLRRSRGLLQSGLKTAGYFFAAASVFAASVFAASALASVDLAYFRRKRSTRPAVSTSFCLPVKNGWQLEQISTWISPRWVDRVVNMCPQAQCTRTS